ncbi:uncharacterized protein LOC128729072 [Anopheles nili]|uniref:uncharacterized protein LOC128729072 n=1 Tax=Anopheles nili TaxID=185578 RepID=UPI00237A9521|nr:uncharacterized protein LOC128729072 [Anopheles nili]
MRMKSILLQITSIVAYIVIVRCEAASDVHETDCVAIHKFLRLCEKLLVNLPFHTYPVFNLCTNDIAIETYNEALSYYRNMTEEKFCQKYLRHNRMNVYETIYNQLTNLWTSANCEACVNAPNQTAQFMALSAQLEVCFKNSPKPCESCNNDYQQVQQFYEQLEKAQHGPDRLCFDIADRMNQSRQAWSGQCCKDKQRSMVVFASIASVACVLPVLFYGIMHIMTIRREARGLNLLSASSGEEATGSTQSRDTNGLLISQPQIDRIVDTDDDDSSGNEIDRVDHISPSASMKVNNLNTREGNLIDITSESENLSQKTMNDVCMLD